MGEIVAVRGEDDVAGEGDEGVGAEVHAASEPSDRGPMALRSRSMDVRIVYCTA